jgi:hypothetical protein
VDVTVDPAALSSVPYGARKALPDQPGLYFALAADGLVLYVGMSKRSMRRRWNPHSHRVRMERRGIVKIAYVVVDDLEELAARERAAISALKPALNSLHVEGAYERDRILSPADYAAWMDGRPSADRPR